jgi:DNA-binding protein HU-beta
MTTYLVERYQTMQTLMTTWEATLKLAAKAGITPEQAKAFLQAQAELAYEFARGGYPIAGIGYLEFTERPERKMVMLFGPNKGKEVLVPAKRVLKFRVAKVAKDIVLGPRGPFPDVSSIDLSVEEEPDGNAG